MIRRQLLLTDKLEADILRWQAVLTVRYPHRRVTWQDCAREVIAAGVEALDPREVDGEAGQE